MSIIQSLTKTASLVKLGALSAALCLSFSNSYAHDGEKKASLGFKTTKLSSDIYVISGVGGFTGGNIGLVVGKEGSVMIDNGVAAVSDLLRSEIRKTTQQPIDYLINTHLHGDHIGNNTQYSNEGAKIISHQNLRASLKKKNDQGLALPVMTFSDQMTLHINNESAKIIHIKDAHTDGDAIIHFENANIIHTGDLMFNGLFPFIDANNGGTLAGVINGLSLIASLSDEETQIIPGHGPMASKTDVKKTIALLKDSRALVKALVDDGKSDEEILAANPLSKYQTYSWGFISTEKMTKQIIANLR